MPEPGSEADEAVRDARQAVYRVDQGRQLACQQVTPMSDDLNLEAALDAYEAAIRASERAKVEALVEALDEAYRVLLIHYRMPHEPTNGDLSSREDVERFDEWMEGVYRPSRHMTERVIELAMEHERRALAGQSEEATG